LILSGGPLLRELIPSSFVPHEQQRQPVPAALRLHPPPRQQQAQQANGQPYYDQQKHPASAGFLVVVLLLTLEIIFKDTGKSDIANGLLVK